MVGCTVGWEETGVSEGVTELGGNGKELPELPDSGEVGNREEEAGKAAEEEPGCPEEDDGVFFEVL